MNHLRFSDIRAQRRLVHNIANHLVMNSSAKALLARGVYPVMANGRYSTRTIHDAHERAEI